MHKRNQASSPGQGTVLLLVFSMLTMVTLVSLQAITQTSLYQTAGKAASYMSAADVATYGLSAIRADIQSKLDAGLTVDTSYSFASTNVQAPSDPAALTTLNTTIGSYSGSVTAVGGDYLVIKSTGVVGSTTASVTQLMRLQQYDCAVVENEIRDGRIALLSDAVLIQYAQNNCMTRQPDNVMAPYTVTASGGSTSCSSGTVAPPDGSGTLQYLDTTGTCIRTMTVDTQNYKIVRLRTVNATFDGTTPNIFFRNNIYKNDITIESLQNGQVRFHSSSARPVVLKTNAVTGAGSPTIYAGGTLAACPTTPCRSGEDLISINGDWSVTGGIATNNNDDIIIIGGNLGRVGVPYIDTGAGYDRMYITSINNACTTAAGTCEPIIYGGMDGDEIYFDAADGNATSGVSPTIYGGDGSTAGDGNDVIACIGAISGTCGMGSSTRLINIYGEDGHDRILIDAAINSSTAVTRTIHGGQGNNIIYIKSKAGTITLNTCLTASNAACSTSTGSGNSLMIVGGNYAGNGYVTATGSNNVLLIKTGNSVTSTSSGFARTLYY